MTAGFARYPVGKLVGGNRENSHVVFFKPPEESDGPDRLITYHNMLVDLCQVGGRHFRTLLAAHASAHPESADHGDERSSSAAAGPPRGGAAAAGVEAEAAPPSRSAGGGAVRATGSQQGARRRRS